ncbi:hypothetical protein SLE2022_265510 [Rubroshorea leprosula]
MVVVLLHNQWADSPDEVGRSWAYGICSVSMFLAILISFSRSKRERYKKSVGSPIVHIFQVVVTTIRKRKIDLPFNADLLYEDCNEASRIQHTDQLCFLDKVALVAEGDFNGAAGSTPNP